ncbi:MAG: TlpA family protein disulfide reductase [Saprospiraceae bacterium]
MNLIKIMLCALILAAAGKIEAGTDPKMIIKCNIANCEGDSMNLYQFDGIVFSRLQTSKSNQKDHIFTFTIPKGKHDFYFLGMSTQEMKPVILGGEDNVSIEGDCFAFRFITVKGSKINQEYDRITKRMGTLFSEMEDAKKLRDAAGNDLQKIQMAEMDLFKNDQKKTAFLDSLKVSNPYLSKIVAMNTILSYQVHGKKKYNDEVNYLAKEYFSFVDFKDPDFNRLPMVFEGFKNFTNLINQFNLPNDTHKEYLEFWLNKFPKNSRAYKMALGGIVTSVMARNHYNYVYFGEKYCTLYQKEDPSVAKELSVLVSRARSSIPGMEPPDFTQNNVDDKPFSMSSLKGKVLLIDFWASWCRPCRMENPNVVKVYNQYKAKGFDILSVSLDSDKGRWLEAIQQDGLIWKNHVSDLKGWKNEVANIYGVSSIPQTLLLDKDGKLIARNLRGEQLEQKLKEILGEN